MQFWKQYHRLKTSTSLHTEKNNSFRFHTILYKWMCFYYDFKTTVSADFIRQSCPNLKWKFLHTEEFDSWSHKTFYDDICTWWNNPRDTYLTVLQRNLEDITESKAMNRPYRPSYLVLTVIDFFSPVSLTRALENEQVKIILSPPQKPGW